MCRGGNDCAKRYRRQWWREAREKSQRRIRLASTAGGNEGELAGSGVYWRQWVSVAVPDNTIKYWEIEKKKKTSVVATLIGIKKEIRKYSTAVQILCGWINSHTFYYYYSEYFFKLNGIWKEKKNNHERVGESSYRGGNAKKCN